jgi:hypothetical protein
MSTVVQAQVDTRAIELSTKALTMIEVHQKDCADRWKEVKSYMRWVLAGVLGLLLGVLGYLVDRFVIGALPGVH